MENMKTRGRGGLPHIVWNITTCAVSLLGLLEVRLLALFFPTCFTASQARSGSINPGSGGAVVNPHCTLWNLGTLNPRLHQPEVALGSYLLFFVSA